MRHRPFVVSMIAFLAFGIGACADPGRPGAPAPSVTAPVSLSPSIPDLPEEFLVEIDLYSGRENPRLALGADVGWGLYAMVADSSTTSLLKPGEPPAPATGFRGFVVTTEDGSLPPLRVLPTVVYFDRVPKVVPELTPPDGGPWQLDDPNSIFYNAVYDAIVLLVDEDVRDALPDSNLPMIRVNASVPPLVGAVATWTVADPGKLTRDSTSVDVLADGTECNSGMPHKYLEPVASFGKKEIVIRVDAVPNKEGAYSCQGSDSVPLTIKLREPIGDRVLVDAACLSRPAIRTSWCAGGAVRWP